jgi:hypothetical protein
MRLIARSGKLHAAECEAAKAGEFILKGIDTTQFEVELVVQGEYQLAGTGEYNYPSEIRIGKDGKLISRTFDVPSKSPDPKYYYEELKKRGYSKDFEYFKKEIKRALAVRDAIHTGATTKSCEAALGDEGGRTILVFICHDYARVMVQKSNGKQSR